MKNILKRLALLMTLLFLTFIFFNSIKVSENSSNENVFIRNSSELSLLKQELGYKEIKIRGKLRADFYDNFDTNEHEVVFYIESQQKKHKVILDEHDGEDNINNVIDFRGLEIEGKQIGFIEKVIDVQSRLASSTPSGIETYKSLVLLVDFSDSNPLVPPYVNDDFPLVKADTLASHLNTEFYRQYFQEVFEGKLIDRITHVEDWYSFNRTCQEMFQEGHESRKGYIPNRAIKRILNIRNIDHNDFDNIFVISNCETWSSWGIAGTIDIDGHELTTARVVEGSKRMHLGFPDSLIPGYEPNTPGTIFLKHLVHERAHNFGIMHSNSLDCRNSQYLYPCPVIHTYGNPHDLMGGSRGGISLNAYKLNRYDIKGDEFFHYVDENGVYELDPLKAQGEDKKIGIFIHSEFSDKPVFMLENRTAMGVDKQLSFRAFKKVRDGAVIYSNISRSKKARDGSVIDFPVLGRSGFNFIDADVFDGISVSEKFLDRAKKDAITKDNSFFDPMTGIRIEVLEPENLVYKKSSIKVRVTYDDDNRVCFKSLLKNQVSDAYISKSPTIGLISQVGSGSEYPIIKRGEEFKIQFRTHHANEDLCPRERIKVFVKNVEDFEDWILPVSQSPGGGGGQGDPGGGGGPVIGGGNTTLSLTKYVTDVDELNTIGRQFELSDGAPLGKHVMHVVYENVRTGVAKESTITFVVEN